MTIITELADGRTEVFESSNYVISKPKDFHPLICKVSVFENGFKIKSVSRPFKFFTSILLSNRIKCKNY